jgi:hypothetical protein
MKDLFVAAGLALLVFVAGALGAVVVWLIVCGLSLLQVRYQITLPHILMGIGVFCFVLLTAVFHRLNRQE